MAPDGKLLVDATPGDQKPVLAQELILDTIVLNMSTTPTSDPIVLSLFPKARRELLGLFFGNPDRAFYLREVVHRTGLGLGHVQREVERLTRGGIIRRHRKGRHVYFQADPSCPVYDELRRLVTKTSGVAAVLKQALSQLSEPITIAFVFGSVARGEERSESDLDLMVIGDASFADVVEAIRGAESLTNRAINAMVYPPNELQSKLAAGHHFLNSVMKRKKLFVVGNEDELRDLLEEQLDSGT
jgi:predicted nucleotidyltransferase